MKKGKNFFYRLEADQLLAALIQMPESERGAWITKVAVELATCNFETPFAQAMHDEATQFSAAKSELGRKAAVASVNKRKHTSTDVEQTLTDVEQTLNIRQPSNSNRSSTEENNLSPNKKSPVYSTPFLEFWNKYPKKVGKGSAWIEWQKHVTPADVDKIMDALEWQTTSPDWTKEGGVYVVDPERYIKRRRWEDERSTAPRAPQYPPNMGLPPGMVY